MFQISEVWAWVSTDDDGEEGIPAFMNNNMWLPMVATDRVRLDALRPIAQDVADQTGKEVRLIKFAGPPEVVETLEPQSPPE